MKQSSTSRRIAMIVVGMMCLSTVFLFGAGSDSLNKVEGAPLGTSQAGSAAVHTTVDQVTAPVADALAAVTGTAPAAVVKVPAKSAPPVTTDPVAAADDGSPSSAAKPPSGDINPPYNLQGVFVPDVGSPYVQLSWTSDNPKSILRSYNIYRVALPDGGVASAPYAVDKNPPYNDTGLTLVATYRYWVTAVAKDGTESGASATVDVETVNVTPPAAPTGLAAFAIDPGVSIDWSANPEKDIVGYRLYTSRSASDKLTLLTTMPVAENHYYDKGGSASLFYWVSAVNKLGLESKATMVVPSATKPVIYEDNDPAITTDGIWRIENYVGPNDGKIIVAGFAGSVLKFSFTGSQVKMTVARYWSCGSAHIYIDGQLVATLNEYSEATTYNVIALNVPGLVHGNHTLTVEVTGSGNPSYPYNFFNVDSFEVR